MNKSELRVWKREQRRLINEIKSRIPNGKKVYLDGHYQDKDTYYLWWCVYKDGSHIYIEYECDGKNFCSHGKIEQQAIDFDIELLESVLQSMTNQCN